MRRIFILASALSLLACLASVLLTFRGYIFLGQFIDPSIGSGLRPVDAPEPSYWTTWWMNQPLLMVTVLTLLPPIFATRALREEIRLRRIHRKLCPNCVYDLTGNTSGTCPECGSRIPPPAMTAGHNLHRLV
jgi:hypothetical protein